MLGNIGGALAIIGVVVCPITSGDTAFRSARLILAEWTKLNQKKIRNRFVSLITSLPATFMSAVSLTYILMALLCYIHIWQHLYSLSLTVIFLSNIRKSLAKGAGYPE